jgi:N utilization substance protein A
MTPEQLEAIEGIGPKTVEKISLAVNNYFASLETGEAAPPGEETEATAGLAVEESAPETAAEAAPAEFAEAPVEAAAEAEPASAQPQPGAASETSAPESSAEQEAAHETKETE